MILLLKRSWATLRHFPIMAPLSSSHHAIRICVFLQAARLCHGHPAHHKKCVWNAKICRVFPRKTFWFLSPSNLRCLILPLSQFQPNTKNWRLTSTVMVQQFLELQGRNVNGEGDNRDAVLWPCGYCGIIFWKLYDFLDYWVFCFVFFAYFEQSRLIGW